MLYNGNALEQSLVQSELDSALAQANLAFSEQIQQAAATAIDALLKGGNLGILGAPEGLIGLKQIPGRLQRIIASEPPGHVRSELQRINEFAGFAAQNLALSKQVLSTISQPIAVHSKLLQGRRTPLNTFAVVVAVSISLMFVCVLLAAGGLALEREEHALPRLLRGLRLARDAARGEGPARGRLLVPARVRDARGRRRIRRARLGRASGSGCSRSRSARSPSARSAWRSARSRARCARRRCSRSCSRCRSRCSRSSQPARSRSGFYEAISAVSFVFPFKACAAGARRGRQRRVAGDRRAARCTWSGLTLVFGALARAGLRRAE